MFKFQPRACNRCHDILIMSMNLGDIAFLNINTGDYSCFVYGISKSGAVNLPQKVDLNEKSGTL